MSHLLCDRRDSPSGSVIFPLLQPIKTPYVLAGTWIQFPPQQQQPWLAIPASNSSRHPFPSQQSRIYSTSSLPKLFKKSEACNACGFQVFTRKAFSRLSRTTPQSRSVQPSYQECIETIRLLGPDRKRESILWTSPTRGVFTYATATQLPLASGGPLSGVYPFKISIYQI